MVAFGARRTAGGLDLEDALLSAVVLESANQGRDNSEDGPLCVCRGARLGAGRGGGIHNALVAPCDVGPIGGRVQGCHGGFGRRSARRCPEVMCGVEFERVELSKEEWYFADSNAGLQSKTRVARGVRGLRKAAEQ